MARQEKPLPDIPSPVVTKNVTVFGLDGREAVLLEGNLSDRTVKLTLLPRQGARKSPVRLADLEAALGELAE